MVQKEISWDLIQFFQQTRTEIYKNKLRKKKKYLGQSRSRLNMSPYDQNIDKDKNQCTAQCPYHNASWTLLRTGLRRKCIALCIIFETCSKSRSKVMEEMTTLMNLSLLGFKTSFSSNSLFLFACIWE